MVTTVHPAGVNVQAVATIHAMVKVHVIHQMEAVLVLRVPTKQLTVALASMDGLEMTAHWLTQTVMVSFKLLNTCRLQMILRTVALQDELSVVLFVTCLVCYLSSWLFVLFVTCLVCYLPSLLLV